MTGKVQGRAMLTKPFSPPKRFRPFQAERGPWLIWSYYHNCWHRRSSDGTACGYTNDVTQAGVFDERTARAYHDTAPKRWRRDVSIPAFKVAAALKHAAIEKRAEAERIEAVLAEIAGRRALENSHDE
ncbi:hypothetical protein [Phenylobacterium kunshanense]|nr:hypothetical protein [Phenylobacterium kunshanense]